MCIRDSRGPADPALLGDVLLVDDFPIAERGGFQKAMEGGDVAHQRFFGNLFSEIVNDV